MPPLKLKKGEVVFRNPEIFAVDTKAINLDRVLTNLYMRIFGKGRKVDLKMTRQPNMQNMKDFILASEGRGEISGASEYPEAVEDWLRSNLLEMVNRGNVMKESITTLRPLHLMSLRIQNRKLCQRELNTADQLYIMLRSCPEVCQGLEKYLSNGWDNTVNEMISSSELDVDTVAIINLTKQLKANPDVNSYSGKIPDPFLTAQTDLFIDDVRRLLRYQDKLPRSVFIDYLKILCGFHLTLYTFKLVYLLPKMVQAGTRNVEDNWSMVVDMTDKLEGPVAGVACKDMENISNLYRSYIRSTFMINIIQNRLSNPSHSASIEETLNFIKNNLDKTNAYYEIRIADIRNEQEDEDKPQFDEMLKYFDDDDYFDKYLYLLECSNLGNSQYKYLRDFIDAAGMKNAPSMLLHDGRSRKHPRRGAIGPKLLELLVQLLVITKKNDGTYYTRPLSIDELIAMIRERYGLIINGIGEERFKDCDILTHEAFKINTEAFKDMLRQIGFYTDLSDACILQKIHPRYKIDD